MVAGRGWPVSHFLRVWWKRSTFPQVVGWLGGVDLCDAVAVQFGFKAVAPALAASESGSEDHAVIGQRGVWDAMLINGFGEFCDDYGAGDAAVGGHR